MCHSDLFFWAGHFHSYKFINFHSWKGDYGMGRYTRLSTRFWNDLKLNNNERLLFFYAVTSPHSNSIGFYVLPKLYIMHDLEWSRQRLARPFSKLLGMGLIKYCDKTSTILIPDFLKHNSIQNENQAIAAVKTFRRIPEGSLHDDFMNCIKQYAEPFIKLFEGHLPKGAENDEWNL